MFDESLFELEEFNSIIKNKGGIYSLDHKDSIDTAYMFMPTYKRISEHCIAAKNDIYQDKEISLSFALLANFDANAIAYTSPRKWPRKLDFIGINLGTYFTLHHIFSIVMSDPRNFPEIGDPDKEDRHPQVMPHLTTNVYKSQIDLPRPPKCPIRSAYAGELVQCAFDFLTNHEISHICNGHLEYCRNSFGFTSLPEAFDTSEQKSQKNKIRQTLELDADSGAIKKCLGFLGRINHALENNNSISQEMKNLALPAYGSIDKICKTLMLSIYFLFRIFDNKSWTVWDQRNFSHPFPQVRAHWISATLREILIKYPEIKYDPDDFYKAHTETIINAELACARLLGSEYPEFSFMNSIFESNNFIDYLDSIHSTWNEIRPLLDMHKRGGRLAGWEKYQ